jgi:hypothetical protein
VVVPGRRLPVLLKLLPQLLKLALRRPPGLLKPKPLSKRVHA